MKGKTVAGRRRTSDEPTLAPSVAPASGRPVILAARTLARRMREDILDIPAGAFLGSESELIARYVCSRATLRQAARLLEHQHLLHVKRGVGGGYYGLRPDQQAVSEASALFLRLHRTTWGETLDAAQALQTVTVRMAALSEEDDARKDLERIAARFAPEVGPLSPEIILADENELFECLMRMIRNPPLEMFQRTLFVFGRAHSQQQLYHGHPERWTVWRRGRRALIEAILDRDPELAVLMSRRLNRLARTWLTVRQKRDVAAVSLAS